MQTSLGGVARNISDAILRLGHQCLLITAVGNDQQGQQVRENNSNAVMSPLICIDHIHTNIPPIIECDRYCAIRQMYKMT